MACFEVLPWIFLGMDHAQEGGGGRGEEMLNASERLRSM